MSSPDSSPDPEPADTEPVTPPRRLPATPPFLSSPSSFASPGGGSLHRLGISPFANQFSLRQPKEPDSRPSSTENDDAAGDSRDVLAQRLADLVDRVSSGRLSDESVSEMHHRVDEMEDALKRLGRPAAKRRRGARPKSLDIDAARDTGFWGSAPSPTALLRSGFSDPTHLSESTLQKASGSQTTAGHRSSFSETTDEMSLQLPALVQMGGPRKEGPTSVENAARIAREAKQLNFHLATLITRLQARQEESEHIHALLIERAERAAQRIIVLEEQVQDLTSSLSETTADLSNLRIALKAIELQCPPPQHMDEDLRRSIQKWKSDWKRMKETRRSRHAHEASLLSSPGTPW